MVYFNVNFPHLTPGPVGSYIRIISHILCNHIFKLNINLSAQRDALKTEEKQTKKMRKKALGLSYLADECPPWYIAIMLGFQVS